MKLIVFGDGLLGMRSAANRLCKQANECSYFNSIEKWDLNRLKNQMPDFFSSHLEFIKMNSKGLGHWLWQPAVLLAALRETQENELVLMLDAGCQINSNKEARTRMNHYSSLARKNGALFMQITPGEFGSIDLRERSWTKQGILDLFLPSTNDLDSPQIQSGVILMVNNQTNRRFVESWLEHCVQNSYKALGTTLQDFLDSPTLIQNRDAQSVLSIMVKQSSYSFLADETYWFPDWHEGDDFPILTMRNRSGGDAVRRNPLDLFLILLAKMERESFMKSISFKINMARFH